MTFLLFFLFSLDPVHTLTSTDAFQPLIRDEVLVSREGMVFVVAFTEGKVHCYGSDGEKVYSVGGKGEGPGRLNYPTKMWSHDRLLYVYDMLNNSVSVFDAKTGDCKDRVTVPRRGLVLEKAAGGWVLAEWGPFGAAVEAPKVYFCDDQFKNEVVLTEVQHPGSSRGASTMAEGNKRVGTFSPIENRPKLLTSKDKKILYLTDTRFLKISKFDLEKKQLVDTIQLDEPAVPFDEDWAEELFQSMGEEMVKTVQWTKKYPERFPVIRDICFSAEGNLVVDQWRGKPDKYHHYLTITTAGKKLGQQWESGFIDRVMGFHDGYCYITTWDNDEEEAGVAKVKLADLNAFLKENPIIYDGPTGRSINISL